MQLHFIDFLLIGIYLLSTVVIGLYLKKKASKNFLQSAGLEPVLSHTEKSCILS